MCVKPTNTAVVASNESNPSLLPASRHGHSKSALYWSRAFLVGPQLSRRQFVGAITSDALSTIQGYDKKPAADHAPAEVDANLVLVDANYDDESGQVKVRAEVSCGTAMTKLAISYNVSILAELPTY